MTAEQDLMSYLASKGLKYYRAAGNEVTTHCVYCADGDPKGKGKLYLNSESWLYECKRCMASGNRKTLLEFFGDEDELKHEAGFDPMLRRRLLTEAAELAHEMLLANDKKLQYLLDRGVDGELILSQKLGYVPPNVGLSEMIPSREKLQGFQDLVSAGLVTVEGREFFNDCITIPYFSHGTVIQIRAKFIDGKYLTAGGDNVRLYNADSMHGADRVLITEGEFDGLAVRSRILESNDRFFEDLAVVSIPGAGSWPEGFVDQLRAADMRKVFIGLDPDEVGEKAAKKLKAEIGNKARIVELPSGEPKTDWTDFFLPVTAKNPGGGHGWRDLRDLLVESDLAGKQVFNITDISTKWSRQKIEAPGLKLGWPSIDAVIRPGLRPGQVMIPLAKSGCIQGDAEMWVNRAGKSFHISLRDLVHMQNGGGRGKGGSKRWDMSIPTKVQREVDGEVRLGQIKAAWFSGDKQTYTVTTESGRQVRATDEHPFLTERGWLRLDQLVPGDLVHVRGERIRRGRSQTPIATEVVTSVEPYGVEPTYDIEVEDDPHNFIANGFVVHNTGKTVWLSNIAHNLRNNHVLYVSLEMTGAEVYEHLHRIHKFWNPKADHDQLLRDYERLRVVEKNRIQSGDLGDYVKEYHEDVGHKPEVVIVDYLQYFARGFKGGTPYERASDSIMETKAVGKEEGCAFIIPSQVNRGAEHGKPISPDDARDSGVVEETGDFVLSLFRPDQVVDKQSATGEMLEQNGDFRAQILKSRHGGKGRIAPLRMSLQSLVIVDQVFDRAAAARVAQENASYRAGVTYGDLRAAQNAEHGQDELL